MRTSPKREQPIASPFHVSVNNFQSGKANSSIGNKLLEYAPNLILVVDHEGTILHSNAACQSILQFHASELSGCNFLELVVEEDQKTTSGAIMESRSMPELTGFKNFCYRKDRTRVPLKWSVRWDHSENMLYCFGEDISERSAQEDLAFLEKEIIQLNMQPGISVRQVTHTLLEKIEKLYPGTVCSILRLQPDYTLGHYSAPNLPKEYTDLINGAIPGPKTGSCGTAVHHNQVIIVSDIQKDPLWEDYKNIAARFGLKACWSVPIHYSKGSIFGTFAIYHYYNKTPTEAMLKTIERLANLMGLLIENSEMVESLRLSNERYKLVAQATHDMIWDWDLQKNEIFRNEEGLRNIYGFSTNDPIRHINDWVQRIHAEDRYRVKQAIYAIHHDQKDIFQVEYRFLRGDGEYVHIYDRGYIMRDQSGKAIRLIGAAQDITERALLQDQLMDEKNARQKEIMKAAIGVQEKERKEIGLELHDNVNQILTSAKLYLECVGLYDDQKEDYRLTSFNLIDKGIEELRRLSKSLVPPRLNDVGLIQSIEDILENIRVIRQLSIEFCHEGFDETRSDPGLMLSVYRIIQEQTTNILKHAEASAVKIRLYQENDFLVLRIADNGKGFDPSLLRKGIGFTNIINRSAVYQGKAEIDSSPGKGCTLSIIFDQNI